MHAMPEQLVCIALDFDTEMTEAGKSSNKEMELPDGNIITVGSEPFHLVRKRVASKTPFSNPP